MAYEWSAEEYARKPQVVQDARALLQKWYYAMESGEVLRWMPDPMYPAVISTDVADAIVVKIDEEFDRELRAWASLEAAGSYEVGPEFSRLLPPQRLALAQQLHTLKRAHGIKTPPVVEPTVSWDTGWTS